jgi:predicted HicB family RNase H-like nuclease
MTVNEQQEIRALTVRIPADLHDWVRRAAFDTRRPINSVITQALEELRAASDPAARMGSGAESGAMR